MKDLFSKDVKPSWKESSLWYHLLDDFSVYAWFEFGERKRVEVIEKNNTEIYSGSANHAYVHYLSLTT